VADVSARIWQVLIVVAFGACVFFAIRLLDRPSEVRHSKPTNDAVDVVEAIGVGQERELGVTGYLFDGGGWSMRLCQGLRRGSPPECVGPFLYVEGVDVGQFNTKKGTLNDRPQRWVDEQVVLLGRLRGTTLTVSQVLSTPR